MEEKTKQDQKARSQRGASMVEYALVVALVAVIAIAGFQALGTALNTQLNAVAGRVQNPNQ